MKLMFWAVAILAIINLESTTQVNAVSISAGQAEQAPVDRVKQAMIENN